MIKPFDLSVIFNGKAVIVPARIIFTHYDFKVCVSIHNTELFFEHDNNARFRVISYSDEATVDKEHVTAIITALEKLAI